MFTSPVGGVTGTGSGGLHFTFWRCSDFVLLLENYIHLFLFVQLIHYYLRYFVYGIIMASKEDKNAALYAQDKNAALYALIAYIIYFLVIVFAMYLVYVRNEQSGAREIIAGILSALCCTPCYIGYAFATPVL